MSRIKWVMLVVAGTLVLLVGMLTISYFEYKNAANYRMKISMLGHELVETRDLITLNSINEVTASYELARHLVKLEQEIYALNKAFEQNDSKYFPFSKLHVFSLLTEFSDTAISVSDALDHIIGVLVARESALNAISTLTKVNKGQMETNLFAPFLSSLSADNSQNADPELIRLVRVYHGLNQQLQGLMGTVLSGQNASFVEEIEHQFTDLVQSIEQRMVVILFVTMCIILAALTLVYFDRTRELQRNNIAYKESVEKAKYANESKSLFLATMSHELRTPMNGVLGIAQLIKEQSNEPDIKSQAQIMIESGQHLVTLLNDILDFSKVEQGKMSLELMPFTFDSVVRHVEGALAPLAEGKGIGLEIHNHTPTNLRYIGDPSRVRQILFNILGNAIKFTEEGQVTLSIHRRSEQAHNLIIEVKDTGIGISEEKLNAIFSPFEQAELSTTRNYGGTGLGLAIVKQLIELMNGEISVFSQPNVGSEFTIKLNLATESPMPEPVTQDSNQQQSQHTGGLNILLAEDNKVNALVMKQFFKTEGYSVTHVTTGQEAIDKLEQQPFDLVVMDNHMPKMSGIEAIKHIRNEMSLDVCIFAFTADVFKDAHDAFIAAGADYVLTKPLQINSIRDAIARFVLKDVTPPVTYEQRNSSKNVVYLKRSPIEILPMTEEELSQSCLLIDSGLSKQEIADLLATFIEEVELKIGDLIEAYAQSSSEILYTTLHSIKGILFEFGLKQASALAEQAEQLARQGTVPNLTLLQSLINRLQVNVHQAHRYIADQHQQLLGREHKL